MRHRYNPGFIGPLSLEQLSNKWKVKCGKRLIKTGRKMLGSGVFSHVYEGRSGQVIKIGPTDDCWLAFAQFCMNYRGPGRKHLPKIYKLRIYPQIGLFVAHVERLGASMRTVSKDWCILMFDQPRDYLESGRVNPWYDGRLSRGYGDKYTRQFTRVGSPGFKLIETLIDFADKFNMTWDLHHENAMTWGLRVIITDPFSFGKVSYEEVSSYCTALRKSRRAKTTTTQEQNHAYA